MMLQVTKRGTRMARPLLHKVRRQDLGAPPSEPGGRVLVVWELVSAVSQLHVGDGEAFDLAEGRDLTPASPNGADDDLAALLLYDEALAGCGGGTGAAAAASIGC